MVEAAVLGFKVFDLFPPFDADWFSNLTVPEILGKIVEENLLTNASQDILQFYK